MPDTVSRRTFIKKGALFLPASGVVIASAPFLAGSKVSSIVSNRELTMEEAINEFVAQTVPCARNSNQFEAQAAGLLFVARLLGSLASVATILDYLGIRPRFAYRPDYQNASQCTGNFQSDEGTMRQARMDYFAGVGRSPHNRDVAMLASAENLENNSRAHGSMQFQANPTVTMRGNETEANRAAADFVQSQYGLAGRDLTNAIAITGREVRQVEDPSGGTVAITRFDNARGGYTFFNPRPFREFNGGTISVYQPGLTRSGPRPVIGLRG